jgi:cobalt/nickel transport system permease protein
MTNDIARSIPFNTTGKQSPEKAPLLLGSDRSALLITGLFTLFVVSIPKFDLSGVIAFAAFPLFIMAASGISFAAVLKKLLLLSPFVLFMAAGNILLDRTPFSTFEGITITGGLMSGSVIVAKTVITVTTLLCLGLYIPFYRLFKALGELRVPEVLVTQLILLYRYSIVLREEAASMQKAREMRAFKGRGKGMFSTANLLGSLLLRTTDRAERLYRSMFARGFNGHITTCQPTAPNNPEWLAISLWSVVFTALRLVF